MVMQQTAQYGLEVQYTEPSGNALGKPLTDLRSISLVVELAGKIAGTLTMPASSPTGGQQRYAHVAIQPRPKTDVVVRVTAKAVNTKGILSKAHVVTQTLNWAAL